MTIQPEARRKNTTSFAVALAASLLSPVEGFLFLQLMLAIAPKGPEGLGAAVVGIAGLGISILLAAVLLVVIAITSAVSNRTRRSDAQAEPGEAPRTIYILVTVLAAAPIFAGLLALLINLSAAADSHATTPHQSEAKVKQTMEASLNDAGYKTLPGYREVADEINIYPHEDSYGTTSYSASTTLVYANAKAMPTAQKRLIAKGWTCHTGAVAPVAEAEALAATGTKSPNAACSKKGREVLNLTYISPTRALLQASTDGEADLLTTPTDASWCKSYEEDQTGDVRKACQSVLGEDPVARAGAYGLSEKCYKQIYGNEFSTDSSKKVTKACFDEFKKAHEEFEQSQSTNSARSR